MGECQAITTICFRGVNCYLIKTGEGRYVLIDTGFSSQHTAIEQALALWVACSVSRGESRSVLPFLWLHRPLHGLFHAGGKTYGTTHSGKGHRHPDHGPGVAWHANRYLAC